MATVRVIYKLNEIGRKASLLAAGNGKRVQIVDVEATPDLLALSEVDAEGRARIVACACVSDGQYSHHGLARYYRAERGEAKEVSVSQYDHTDEIDAPPAPLAAYVLGIAADNERRKAEAEAE